MEEEKEKEPLCRRLSFSERCKGGLAEEVFGEGLLWGELDDDEGEWCGKVAVLGVVAGVEGDDDRVE